jgi:hypothetical protein
MNKKQTKDTPLNASKFLENISTNKLFLGLMMIFMNIGSRYIELKLTKGQEVIFKNIAREILIFTIAFMGSRDIIIAFVITAVFIILSNFVFNENCYYNILPSKYRSVIDINGDVNISMEEIQKAQAVLDKAKHQEKLNHKINMLNNLSSF